LRLLFTTVFITGDVHTRLPEGNRFEVCVLSEDYRIRKFAVGIICDAAQTICVSE